ncbi:MAG TPA: response regulator transcription factor [Streptosporangiaceae bacterium]|jgi:DNA-binding NarL/FixJ family response regulator|nr:response regulator transcription factor [Streptosporangiaceae bacterium]
MTRVAIVDDHPIARRGVEQILAESGIAIVTSAATADLLEPRSGADVDVIVLDLYHDGDEPCLEAIARLSAEARILVMSVSGRPADVVSAIRAGAAGYLTKQASPEEFVRAVEAVASGGFYLSSQLADILATQLRPPDPVRIKRPGLLSKREEETLDLIARGFTHAQAARRLGISKATIDTYIERVRAKLQVGNKAELTRAALIHLQNQP